MIADEERLARAALSYLAEPGTRSVLQAVDRAGAVDTWAAVRAGRAEPELTEAVAPRLRGCDPERDLQRLARCRGRLLCPGDDEWPARLADLRVTRYGEPLALWVRGPMDLRQIADHSIAVVGARAATAYGEYVAAELAATLAERGWLVTSGGAYGIDAAAHRGALAGGSPTAAFLACGVDLSYPRAHRPLFERILSDGALVSESPPGFAPQRLRFLSRNRLLAALADGTVVVEAGIRSGALSTARWARSIGRHVMAVPGPVTSAMSGGCHKLVWDNDAVMVTSADQVGEVVGRLGVDLAPSVREPEQPRDRLEEEPRRVLEAVPAVQAAEVGSIAAVAGVDMRVALGCLQLLQAAGLVTERGDRWRLARP